MAHIAGFERDQLLLLPEAVDDYVDADNPVRFIDAFVDGLDLAAAGIAVGYNVQVAVDSKNKMIVEQAVANQVVDMGLLTLTAAPAGHPLHARDGRPSRKLGNF